MILLFDGKDIFDGVLNVFLIRWCNELLFVGVLEDIYGGIGLLLFIDGEDIYGGKEWLLFIKNFYYWLMV